MSDSTNSDEGGNQAPARQGTALWLTVLLEEYKILQGKIDKIGEFRIKTKEWSITLVLAFVLGAKALEATPHYLLMLPPSLCVLWWLEWRQQQLQAIFGDRSYDLENVIKRGLRADPEANGPSGMSAAKGKLFLNASPHIAHAIRHSDKPRDSSKMHWLRRQASGFINRDRTRSFYVSIMAIVMITYGFRIWLGESKGRAQAVFMKSEPRIGE